MEICDVKAREILDSRGNPTVEVDVYTEYSRGRFAVPSGASTGKSEALELRDKEDRYCGKGVQNAVGNVNDKIAEKVIGMDATDQRGIDLLMIELDGTPNKEKLGANAMLGVSIAVAKAAASTLEMPLYKYLGGPNARVLPTPCMNVINGGAHAGNELDIQEHMLVPKGASSFSEAVRMNTEIFHALKKVLKDKYGVQATNVGDEGGYAPPMKQASDAFEAILKAIEEAGYTGKVKIGIDSAASGFYSGGSYTIAGKKYTSEELVDLYKDLVSTYPIVFIEDGFAEDDWEGFRLVTKELGSKIQIIGDDLFVTNIKRLRKGIETGACNSLLLKVNQIGTLTETLEAAELAFRNKYSVLVSHRSGETEDSFIADLSVALNSGQIKTGAPCRSDRTAKYNQLLRIEEELAELAIYTGGPAL